MHLSTLPGRRSLYSFGQTQPWVTVAEGTTLDTLVATVPDREFGKDVPIRFELELKFPFAKLFDLAGAEAIFRSKLPEGLDLVDVHSQGNSKVIIEAVSDPVSLAAIVAFVAARWLAIALVTIGITLALGLLVIAIKVKSPEEFLEKGVDLVKWGVIGGLGIGSLLLVRELIRPGRVAG